MRAALGVLFVLSLLGSTSIADHKEWHGDCVQIEAHTAPTDVYTGRIALWTDDGLSIRTKTYQSVTDELTFKSFSDILALEAASLSASVANIKLINTSQSGTLANHTLSNTFFGSWLSTHSSNTGSHIDWSNTSSNLVTTGYVKASSGNYSFVVGGTGTFTKLIASEVALSRPYAQFWSTNTQAVVSAASNQIITLEVGDYTTGISHSNTTNPGRITFTQAGCYEIILSGVYDSSSNGKHIEVWGRKGGSDITDSNTRVEIANANTEGVIAVAIIVRFSVGEYFEWWMYGDSTDIRFLATPAATSPVRPRIPSVIVTVKKLSC